MSVQTEKRTKRVEVRFTLSEKLNLTRRAEERGVTVSDLIREIAVGVPVPGVERQETDQLVKPTWMAEVDEELEPPPEPKPKPLSEGRLEADAASRFAEDPGTYQAFEERVDELAKDMSRVAARRVALRELVEADDGA